MNLQVFLVKRKSLRIDAELIFQNNFIMYDQICLGGEGRKRGKNDKYYLAANISLTVINNLREKDNTKKRRLDKTDSIPQNARLCKSCYALFLQNPRVSVDPNTPDLSFYRKRLNIHSRCTFGCKNPQHLLSVPDLTTEVLLMNYKFYIIQDSRMCSAHLQTDNF